MLVPAPSAGKKLFVCKLLLCSNLRKVHFATP